MALTRAKKDFYEYCDSHEFISDTQIEYFRQLLEQDDSSHSLAIGLEDYKRAACPKCGATGEYKWHIFGKLKHPNCGHSWYVAPLTYIGSQFGAACRTGRDIGGEMISDAEKKGEKGGCFEVAFGLFIGFAFRLPFGLLVATPIQLVLYLTSQKSLDQEQPEEELQEPQESVDSVPLLNYEIAKAEQIYFPSRNLKKRSQLLLITGGGLLVVALLIFGGRKILFGSKSSVPVPGSKETSTQSDATTKRTAPEVITPSSRGMWQIEPAKLFSPQGEPLLPDISALVVALESRTGEGEPVTKQEFMEMLSRPQALTVYRDEIIKYATPASLAIQKKEHEDYTKIFMRESYQKAGLEFLWSQREYLERAEQEYGVLQRDIVSVLIWESGLGKYTGDYQEFSVFLGQILFLDLAQKTAVDQMIAEGKPNPLADAACAQKERMRLEKRKESAITNLAVLLRVCRKEGLNPLDMKGSWGGAIGNAQFMPVNLKYAVDGDMNGKINLSQWPDAIMSVARYLKMLGKYDATDEGRKRALLRYNPSREYAAGVMLVADAIWQRHLNSE